MADLLQIDTVSSGYGRTEVLHEISMEIGEGKITALIGANGAGKSTLLNTIIGTVAATAGQITFKDQDITRLGTQRIVQQGISLVPERRQLFGTMTVEENLLLGAYVRTKEQLKGLEADLEEQYNLFPVLLERRRQLAQSLSGGEQQMLAIARARMSHPSLLLMDEPSLGLAPIMVEKIFAFIQNLRGAGATILLVEQNAQAALSIADTAHVLETGRLTVSGSAGDLLHNKRIQNAYLGGEDGGTEGLESRIRQMANDYDRRRSLSE